MKVRNIFFNEDSFFEGKGTIILEYYGRIYTHATKLPDFFSKYDGSKDIVISCNECAKKDYKRIVKVENKTVIGSSVTNNNTKPNNKPATKTVSKKNENIKQFAKGAKIPEKNKDGNCIACQKKRKR